MRRFALLMITMALVTGLFALGCGGGGGGGSKGEPFLESYTGNLNPSSVIDTTAAVGLAMEAGFAGRDVMESKVEDAPLDTSVVATSTALVNDYQPLAIPYDNCIASTTLGSVGGTLVSGFCITASADIVIFADAYNYQSSTETMDGYMEVVADQQVTRMVMMWI